MKIIILFIHKKEGLNNRNNSDEYKTFHLQLKSKSS